ncbi:MarR family transcriptional regulator [Nocardia sp. ET3-3]|uniref:MarR family transcriptional regulator n=1 Tax=Nocardia terrae TaxID=2675851 RepID=A0A7K1V7Y5_9NOCA|nr:MarR family winged helix-turn-helix transcriptional regulator [Nocardia terrae]MVU82765.1 MarR family transcriptional regulator [Nocardia terrae]
MTTADAAIARHLSGLLGPLRRAVLRRTRAAAGLPDLPDAQIELLRALTATGSATPKELADRLRMAPSTISNLVRAMTGAHLITRTASETDLRVVHLAPSALARDLLDRYDSASAQTLQAAIDALPPADRKTLRAALPALTRLLAELERS